MRPEPPFTAAILLIVSRLRKLAPGELSEAQAALYDAIAGGDRAKGSAFPLTEEGGALVGPFNCLLYSPHVGDAVQKVGSAVRFGSEMSARVREIVTLTVARHWRSDFEWWAHDRIARRVGFSDAELAALKDGREIDFDDRAERTAHRFCLSVLETGDAPDDLYAEAVADFGESGVCDLVVLIGYYGLIAQMMRVFRVVTPDGSSVFAEEG